MSSIDSPTDADPLTAARPVSPGPNRRPRRTKHRPNWPYRIAWLIILGLVAGYVGIGTAISSAHASRFHAEHDWQTAFVARALDATFAVWFVAFGGSIGSFLNVVAYRLPLGRTLGGHSGCPYCRTKIAGSDNIPVLAWLKLRGRCRTCHLPISPQYPLVEFAVAMVFLFVFITEFARAGANLPGSWVRGHGYGIAWTNISFELASRTCAHLFVISGLFGAALIAVKNKTVPMKLYVWILGPLAVAVFVWPSLIIVPWWPGNRVLSSFDARLDSLVSLAIGLVAGVWLGRMLAPLLYGSIDRTLVGSDAATTGARQWIGAMGVAGAAVGWQSICHVTCLALICQLVGMNVFRRFQDSLRISDATVWVWCGLLLLRAVWRDLNSLGLFESRLPPVAHYLVLVSLLVPLCLWVQRCSRPAPTPPMAETATSALVVGSDSAAEESD